MFFVFGIVCGKDSIINNQPYQLHCNTMNSIPSEFNKQSKCSTILQYSSENIELSCELNVNKI